MRVKGGVKSKRRHKRILERAKGYYGSNRVKIRRAIETLLHAGQYAYDGRKMKKRDFRSLWITRINIAVRERGIKYSTFMSKMKDHNVELDRKILSRIAVEHPQAFDKIVDTIKE